MWIKLRDFFKKGGVKKNEVKEEFPSQAKLMQEKKKSKGSSSMEL